MMLVVVVVGSEKVGYVDVADEADRDSLIQGANQFV